ncbi:zinc ribbon domain-containing protein [Fictibacillus phosphorivorans]|uniref:zinc ribbon domain-containing protein n=1 Tax=Fictibacillus phosphorivorans TaxID=1221500 RepID=UPI0035E7F2A4
MTGSSLSKFLDIQQNHFFLFVSCENCGFVRVYDPNVLEGKKRTVGICTGSFIRITTLKR